METAFLPMSAFAADWGDVSDVSVFRLETRVIHFSLAAAMTLHVVGYQEVPLPARAPREAPSSGSSEGEGWECSSADCESLCTDVESAAEDEVEEDDEPGSDSPASDDSAAPEGDAHDEGDVDRAARGDHVRWADGYFTMSEIKKHGEVKIHIKKRWCTKGELGGTDMSKTVKCAHYGDLDHVPVVSYLVLRSWMLWRARRGHWSSQKNSRMRWFEREEARLRKDIADLGGEGGSTGNAAADNRIRMWSPQVMKV